MNITFCLLLFIVGAASKTKKQKANVLPEVWNDIAYQYLQREGNNPTCQGCAKVRTYLGLPEVNVTDIRIELAKQNILKKLGMESAPMVVEQNKNTSLPHPILDGDVFKQARKPLKKRRLSTEQVIIMASDIACSTESTIVNLKFSFEIPERIRRSQITSAAMWLHSNVRSDSNQFSTCLLTTKPCGLPSNIKSKEINVQTSDAKTGWIEKDVLWWLQGKENCQRFKLSCSGDAQYMFNCSQYNEKGKKPFLMIEEASDELLDIYREKRHVNCVEGVTDCCREKLYISFSDIGWSDWIIQPKGYEAYYCKGTCLNAAAISLSGTPYHSVLKRLFLTKGQAMEITPCCTPTRLSPVQLIYMDQNGTFIQKTIPDLTVESCGCM